MAWTGLARVNSGHRQRGRAGHDRKRQVSARPIARARSAEEDMLSEITRQHAQARTQDGHPFADRR